MKEEMYDKNFKDAGNKLIDMHLIQSLKSEFCFDLPLFSKYLATSINRYFYKMTLLDLIDQSDPVRLVGIVS